MHMQTAAHSLTHTSTQTHNTPRPGRLNRRGGYPLTTRSSGRRPRALLTRCTQEENMNLTTQKDITTHARSTPTTVRGWRRERGGVGARERETVLGEELVTDGVGKLEVFVAARAIPRLQTILFAPPSSGLELRAAHHRHSKLRVPP